MKDKKQEVVNLVRSLLDAVPVQHQKYLTTFIKGDKEKLEALETANEKVGVVIVNEDTWGINPITFFNTILSTLIDDNIHLIIEDGYAKGIIWNSDLNKG